MTLKRTLKTLAKRILHLVFTGGQRLGVDVLPRHFYSEVPDIRKLSADSEWRRPYTMTGVYGVGIHEQSEALRSLCAAEVIAELAQRDVHAEACRMNGEAGFGAIEAECLYAYVRTRTPPRILQIGCGVSTAVCLLAASQAGYKPEIVCVEPYPTGFLRKQSEANAIRLVQARAQTLDAAHVESLEEGSLFFVDSTHALGPSGEVTRIILEMLPRLKKGVGVHFHDIRFPYDYDRRLLTEALCFQHESPLLHAFLCYNSRFRIDFCMSMLHYHAKGVLRECFPRYVPATEVDGLESTPGHFPSSLYLKVVA